MKELLTEEGRKKIREPAGVDLLEAKRKYVVEAMKYKTGQLTKAKKKKVVPIKLVL